jgi:hypothetical protein
MEKIGMHNRPEHGYSARDTYLSTLLIVILVRNYHDFLLDVKTFFVYYSSTEYHTCHKCV